jgi:hypothetical protein
MTPWRAYLNQRKNAARRGIDWRFTFEAWWGVWAASGLWEQRGCGRGYCMARFGDVGPYAPDNVYICTIGQNFSDSLVAKPNALRRPAGRGWSFRPDTSPHNPYRVRYRNRDLGHYPTATVAEAVYRAARDSYRLQNFGIQPAQPDRFSASHEGPSCQTATDSDVGPILRHREDSHAR